ncbi:RNA polymerase sigma factor [Pedobacter nyackensis]|uniref:RNA polymerase sigma-70 factor, ECF subfamily n=1 Tax=Pedobacter nyackensis TaxID=475255 RepID=A0A1W2D4K2_9SPHI|nr:sigma-70 family RNA polymerase sigma factor [Pedobacter nyackensis]SMC92024.1 RNA polymerase sigma-70 factor, ECF subfamily [Pedobacter nyackensis]
MKIADTNEVLALLKKVATGDEHSFSLLFDKYRPNIYTTALRIIGDEWTAEEILQDTFLKVWLNREILPDLENFGGWLYTIARNLTYNSIKQVQSEKKKLVKAAKESISVYYRQTDYLTEDKEFEHILKLAIERLPPKQKQTYQLIKEQEMKREEAALALNVSAETVKWNLDQAMRSIRAFCMAHLKDAPLIIGLYFSAKYF